MTDARLAVGPAARSELKPPAPDRLPPTLYVWLALFALSFVLPAVLERITPSTSPLRHASTEGGLSDNDFQKYLEAESETRAAFAADQPETDATPTPSPRAKRSGRGAWRPSAAPSAPVVAPALSPSAPAASPSAFPHRAESPRAIAVSRIRHDSVTESDAMPSAPAPIRPTPLRPKRLAGEKGSAILPEPHVSGSGARSGSKTDATGNEDVLASMLSARSTTELKDAADAYRALGSTTHIANMDRRLLILNRARQLPLDEKFLKTSLTDDLKRANTPPSEIDAELALWRRLYTAPAKGAPRMAKAEIAAAETRLRAMQLRYLENRALEDLYFRAGKPAAAQQARTELQRMARRTLTTTGLLAGLALFAGLLGFGLLVLFGITAASGQWQTIRRAPTMLVRLSRGDLFDAFLFYLASYRLLSTLVGTMITRAGWQLSIQSVLFMAAAEQIGTGIASVAYLAAKARRSGTTLADIGMTTGSTNPLGLRDMPTRRISVLSQIGYGILAYCSALPLLFLAAMIAKAIFRHSVSTTPNPILPLMTSSHDIVSRILICVMASIAAPLIEETFFRGALYTGIRKQAGWVVSAAISALCFALMHPMADWLPIFALGFVLATVREMRQSLIPGITMHFLQNSFAFLMLSSIFSS